MKNPVQKLMKAASQMKNNAPLAQKEAQSPNKINSFAAQMVIPEQQTMQKSKPIPYPVGSVLMQKLAQAQQAALASQMPQPSEGGIAQAAAKGGVLKFAKAGKVTRRRKAKDPLTEDLITTDENSIQNLGEQIEQGRRQMRDVQNQKAALGLGREPAEQKQMTSREQAAKKALRSQSARMDKNAAAIDAAIAKAEQNRVNKARSEGAEDYRKATSPKKPKDFTIEDYVEGTPEERSYQRRLQSLRNQEYARTQPEKDSYARRQRTLVEQSREAAQQDYDLSRVKPSESADTAAYKKRVGEVQKRETAAKREALQAKQNRPVAKTQQGASPDYRRMGIEQAAKAKGVYEKAKTDIARNKEIESETQARAARKEAAANALKTQEGRTTPPGKQAAQNKEYWDKKRERAAAIEKSMVKAQPKTEAPVGPEKTPYSNVDQDAISDRLKSVKGETPATLHAKAEGITEGVIHSDPDVHAEVSKLAADFKSQNPDATIEQMGSHIMDNTSDATRSKFLAKAGPLLQKYGIRIGKAAGAIGAYESAANIGNVAIDPTKSKADVAKAVGHEAVGAVPAVAGAGIGAGMGALTGPAAPVAVPVLGLAGGIAGAVGGDPAVRWMKEKLGMDQEGPQATAKHTIPTVGDVANTVADQFSGDSWNKSPEQRARDEIAAMPEDEETLRLERMGRGEMSLPEIARGAPPAAESKSVPPAQGPAARPTVAPSSRGAAPAGQTPAAQQQPGGGGIAASPQAPKVPGAGAQTDQYAGDTSEATPEGAVQELMKLRGPSYAYSPEVMGMLKDARDEDRAATALSMFAGMGAGLANRDRYQGAHDAALLANQAFTSGREREGQAEQRFLQGIIHNEQIPYEQRQAAYETYVKMQMAAAQNEALYGRALLSAGARRYASDRSYDARTAAGGRDWAEKQDIDSLNAMLRSIDKELEASPGDPELMAQARQIRNKLATIGGLAGGKDLGQTRPQPTTLDVR